MQRTNFGLLLAKIESTYGTNPAPTGGLNTIAVTRQGVTFAPNFDHLTRMLLDGTISKVSGQNAMPSTKLSFRVELRGNYTNGGTDTDISSGASAQAVEIDCLLRACDLTATYTPESTDGARDGYVTYTPTVPTSEGASVTFYYFTGETLHIITGAKGTMKAVLEAGKYGYLDFEFSGIYNDAMDAALPAAGNYLSAVAINAAGSGYAAGDLLTVAGGTASTAATIKVLEVNAAGAITRVKIQQIGLYSINPTTTANAVTDTGAGAGATMNLTMTAQTAAVFLDTKPPLFQNSGSTVDSYSPVFQKIEVDLGNQVQRRDDANAAKGVRGFLIVGRDSKLTIDPESTTEAVNPVWTDLEEATARTITAKIGTIGGNKFQGTFTGVSQAVGYGDRSNIRTSPIDYSIERANPSTSAGGEFQLKFY
jgi:hypothetical protein